VGVARGRRAGHLADLAGPGGERDRAPAQPGGDGAAGGHPGAAQPGPGVPRRGLGRGDERGAGRPRLAAAADSDDAALESAREWKGTLVDENYAEDVTDPAQVGELGEQNVSDRKYKMMAMLSADPGVHVRQIKAMQAMGATAVVVMNVSGADPLGTIRLYGEHVLPELRG
jgi:hypothetical protein